jgi:hypothetical protein
LRATGGRLAELRDQIGGSFTAVIADAADRWPSATFSTSTDPGRWCSTPGRPRFIADYAAAESEREKLGIRFMSVLPQLTPATGLGAAATAAYAVRQGVDIANYLEGLGPALTPEQAGEAITGLVAGPGRDQGAYLLTAAGLSPVQN